MGCSRRTAGKALRRLAVRGAVERSGRVGGAHRLVVDPQWYSIDEGADVFLPSVVVRVPVAEMYGLEPLTSAEFAKLVEWAANSDYDGCLLPGRSVVRTAAWYSARRKGYLTGGRRPRWPARFRRPPPGYVREALKRRNRYWGWRSSPRVCGRFGALRRWRPRGQRIGVGNNRQRTYRTQCKSFSGAIENRKPSITAPEAGESTSERGPPRRRVDPRHLDEHRDQWSRWWNRVRRPDGGMTGEWQGPRLADVLRCSSLYGVAVGRAAALEVHWIRTTGRFFVRNPAALMHHLAGCWTGGVCGWRPGTKDPHVCGSAAWGRAFGRQADERQQRRRGGTAAAPNPVPAVPLPASAPPEPGWRKDLDVVLADPGGSDAAAVRRSLPRRVAARLDELAARWT